MGGGVGKLLVRLGIGLVFVIFAVINYFGNVSENPVTGEEQRVALTPQQEIQLGQQGRQEVLQQFGGLYPDQGLQAYIDRIGAEIVKDSAASEMPYPYEFHVVDDPETVNAFALPGGQIFITTAMLSQLESEAQLAGILAHEVAHVVARHGAEQLARQQLGMALVNAIAITASGGEDPGNARQAALVAQAVNQLVNLRYSRQDELESDRLGFDFMTAADYNPEGLVELMRILEAASEGQPPEFLSTHPYPDSRIDQLQAMIEEVYPTGIPPALEEGEQDFVQALPPALTP